MNVICIGSGYVGSVTATAFAVWGHQTTLIDIDQHKVDCINSGKSPIFEPGLEPLITQQNGQNLRATNSYQAIEDTDAIFICVGTPSKSDGTADLTYVKSAAEQIGKYLNKKKFTVIINKSTVPVGTSDLVAAIIEKTSGLTAEKHFSVVSNPEFLREGFAVKDVFSPERIVIGTQNQKARALMKELYRKLFDKDKKTIYFETDTKSAELIKYASNAFLAVKISYINEIAQLCEVLGANVLDVAKGMGLDTRIGEKFLQVSSGWSGSCFPKDSAELLATSQKYGCELAIVEASIQSNKNMHLYCVEKICRRLKTLNGKIIGVLGLTFKPNTDDARSTQATFIIQKLIDLGADVQVHDPQGMAMFRSVNRGLPVMYCQKAEDVANRADALVLMTHWDEYGNLDWKQILQKMRNPYILDTRNFLSKEQLYDLGFQLEGLGVT